MRTEKLDLCKICGKMFLKTKDTSVCPKCAPEKYLPEFTAQTQSLPAPIQSNQGSIKTNTNSQKNGKWSRKYDCCVNCGRNDVKHLAKGLCLNCYYQETEKRMLYVIGPDPQNAIRTRRERGEITQTLNQENLRELYIMQGKSLEDIAKEYGCSRVHVSKLMKKCGLERRTQSKARIEAMKKGKFGRFGYYEINERFFSEWTPEMSWVLGLLFTDGFISPSSISIWSMDIEIVEKIKKALNSSNPITIQTQSYDKSKHIYRFAFYREKMMEDLKRLGLHQKKSLNMTFPDVPQEYMRHFIRGCWDGCSRSHVDNRMLRSELGYRYSG